MGPLGSFLLCKQPLCSMLGGQPGGGRPGSLLGWNRKELEDKGTDVLLETWLLMTGEDQSGFWKCFRDDSVSTEVSRNDCLSTCFLLPHRRPCFVKTAPRLNC